MSRELKLFNGRLHGYEHAYIAAYSRADAVRIASECFGLRGWEIEIRDYWNAGGWGNQMIGVTPRRGMFARTKDGSLVEFVSKGKTIPLERDDPAAWKTFKAKEQADAEAAEAERQRAREEKRLNLNELWIELGVIDALHSVGCNGERISFEYNGHRYEIREIE